MKVFVDRRFAWSALALAALKLWLVCAQPVFAIGAAGHDERLFLQLADNILNGDWLGNYTEMTLAKGPAYPVFIAATVWVGVPLPLAQHLVYLLACWLLVRALRPLLGSDGWALLLFAALWLQPMSYEMSVLGRVLRQHLYTPAVMLVIAGLMGLHTRRTSLLAPRLGWASLAGVCFGVAWLTREETIWIVPTIVLLVLAGLWFGRSESGIWKNSAVNYAAAAVTAALPILVVCGINQRVYGWFGTNEFRSRQFIAAYGALSRVRPERAIPGVPVTRAARAAIYEVSPAFAELRPWLEGDLGRAWAVPSGMVTNLPPESRELAGGWWMWALRETVREAGHANSAREALAFYQQIADEVNTACERGSLPAGPRHDSMLPVWQFNYTQRMLAETPAFIEYFWLFKGFTARSPDSTGDAQSLQLFHDLTQWSLAPSPDAPDLATPRSHQMRAWRVNCLQRLGRTLRFVLAAMLAAGLAAWLVGLAVRLRFFAMPDYLWWVSTSTLGAVVAVIMVNLLVHVSSFPNLSAGAFAQAYPLAVLFAVTAAADLWQFFRRRQALR